MRVCADVFQDMSKAFNYIIQLLTFYLLYRITGRLPVSIFSVEIAALGSLKRVTGRIFKVILKEQALSLIFLETKNCKNHQPMYRKFLFIIISLKGRDQ